MHLQSKQKNCNDKKIINDNYLNGVTEFYSHFYCQFIK